MLNRGLRVTACIVHGQEEWPVVLDVEVLIVELFAIYGPTTSPLRGQTNQHLFLGTSTREQDEPAGCVHFDG